MMQGKTSIAVLATLVIGFGAGFALRPMIAPSSLAKPSVGLAPLAAAAACARGTQYFAANLEEARRVIAGCKDGSVRGDECANAERALTETEGRDRFKRFTQQ